MTRKESLKFFSRLFCGTSGQLVRCVEMCQEKTQSEDSVDTAR
jgi:hypothetical protein